MANEKYITGLLQTSGQTTGNTTHKVEGLESNAVISAAKITDPEIRLDFGTAAYQKTITLAGENIRINYVKAGNVSRYQYVGDLAEATNVVLNGNAGETCIIRGRVRVLHCNGELKKIDVTKATALKSLMCSGNNLTELDVTHCTQLTWLECYNNQLTSLDVTHCTQLEWLECYESSITSLDVTKCTELTFLDCADNQLSELNVTKCTKLTHLDCCNNQLTELDATKCKTLSSLNFAGNNINRILIPKFDGFVELAVYGNNLYDPSDDDSIRAFLDTLPKQKPYDIEEHTTGVAIYMGEEFDDEEEVEQWEEYVGDKGYRICGEY